MRGSKGAFVDGGRSRVGVVAAEGQLFCAIFGEATRSRDRAADCDVARGRSDCAGGGEGQVGVDGLGSGRAVGDRAIDSECRAPAGTGGSGIGSERVGACATAEFDITHGREGAVGDIIGRCAADTGKGDISAIGGCCRESRGPISRSPCPHWATCRRVSELNDPAAIGEGPVARAVACGNPEVREVIRKIPSRKPSHAVGAEDIPGVVGGVVPTRRISIDINSQQARGGERSGARDLIVARAG